MFDFVFETEQARNNEIAAAARTVVEQKLAPGEEKTLTISIDTSNKIDVNVFEPFNTELGTASLRSVGGDDDSASLSFVESGQGGGIISFSNIGSGAVMIEYSLTVASDAPDQVYLFQPNMLDLDSQSILIDGIKQMEVVT
jgi:hypothetical protein